MHRLLPPVPQRVIQWLVLLLLCKLALGILWNYGDYLPPNFESGFLRGRRAAFYQGYGWAFYAHIFSGPAALLLGCLLLSRSLRVRWPRWHRQLGRVQIGVVLLFVAPSGLWMSAYAETGRLAGSGFAALAIATASCVALGWKAAVNRKFNAHRRWMIRGFILLCAALVLRLLAGLGTLAGIEGQWAYPLAAWLSWLVPLAAYELRRSMPAWPS